MNIGPDHHHLLLSIYCIFEIQAILILSCSTKTFWVYYVLICDVWCIMIIIANRNVVTDICIFPNISKRYKQKSGKNEKHEVLVKILWTIWVIMTYFLKKDTKSCDFGQNQMYFKIYFRSPPNKADGGKKFFM